MAQGKKEKIFDGNIENSFTDTPSANILEYGTTLIYIYNTNLSGSNHSLDYSVLATPYHDTTTIDWNTRISGQALTAGQEATHKITDPWDAIKLQLMNTVSGDVAQCRAYINRK